MRNFVVVAAALLNVVPALSFPHMLRDFGASDLKEFEAVAKRGIPKTQVDNLRKRQSGGQLTPISIPLPTFPVPGIPLENAIDIPGIITVGVKEIPDAAHPFQEPGPTDVRGGCPGLNIMANYGYTSRSGIVTAGELIYAMTEMLGYSVDLSLVLVALAIRSGAMDITTLKMSIGGTDSRTNGPGSLILGPSAGLFDYSVHNKYEIDGSMAYDDSYFHKNQANAGSFFNGTRFAKMQALADSKHGGLYDVHLHADHRYEAYKDCIHTNPTCTWNVVGELLFYGADTYTYLGMASSDPKTGQILPPDSKSVQSFFGAQKSGDTFVHVPEKLLPGPEGVWYRRATPLTTAEIAGQIVPVYGAHPVVFGSNNGKAVDTFKPSTTQFNGDGAGAVCLILNQIQENDGVVGSRYGIFAQNAIVLIQTLLAPALKSTGCPATAIN